MPEQDKAIFCAMAEEDRKRYDGDPKKRKTYSHIPEGPRRPLYAFFWFCNDERSKVKAQNPEYGGGDIFKELGRRWVEADSEVKSKYEAMAEKDKARYEKEMTAYKKKNNPNLPAAPVPDSEEEDDEEEEVEDDEDE